MEIPRQAAAENAYIRPENMTAEEELKLAQERFQVIFQNTSVSIWDYDFRKKQIIQPMRSRELHGFNTVVENVPDSLIECGFVHPDSARAFREMYDKLFAGAAHAEGVFRVQTADRSGYWYEHIRYNTVFDAQGAAYAAIGMSTDVTDEIELQQRAESDALTGLLHHNAFEERGKNLLSRYGQQSHALLMIDLDDFKEINDTYGHAVGDEIIRSVGGCIRDVTGRDSFTVLAARVGGDEFSILLSHCDRRHAKQFTDRLADAVKQISVDGIKASASIGIALYPQDGDTFKRLELAADRALYDTKSHQKGQTCFYDSRHQSSALSRHRQKLLTDTLAGGLMGSYLEPGFPFYFIDEELLRRLGYDSEQEYVTDIGGLVSNGIHPDDRDFVLQTVERQFVQGNRYTVDYRMRKKDGSYIWLHEIGERALSSDGRAALTSVCYDISTEKEHHGLLDNLMEGLEARIALYRVEEKTVLTLLRASDGVMATLHYTDEEYREICKDDAMDFVYAPDRDSVRSAIERTMQESIVITVHFRMYNKNGGVTWTTTLMSRFGTDMGRPVLRVIFMPLSIQNELQLQMLDSKYISVYAIDEETDELYYANQTALRTHGVAEIGVAGRTCYDVLYGRTAPCPGCWKCLPQENGSRLWEDGGRFYSIEVQKRTWNGRKIRIVYIRDITDQYLLQMQHESLFDNLPGGICLFEGENQSYKPVFISKVISDIMGITPDEVIQNEDSDFFFTLIHPEDLPHFREELDKAVAAMQKCFYYRYRFWLSAQKKYIWVEMQATITKSGDKTLIYTTYTDLTKVNRIEEQLEESQRAMESVARYCNLGLWRYDLDTRELRQIYRNGTSNSYGASQCNIPDSFIAQESVHPEDAELYRACYQRILDGAEKSECIVRVYDRQQAAYLWLHIYLIRQKDTSEGKRRALGFSFPVDKEIRSANEAKAANQKLRQSKKILELACSFAGLFTFTYDPITQTVYADERAQRELDLPECIQRYPFHAKHRPILLPEYRDTINRAMAEIKAGAIESSADFQTMSPNGSLHWMRLKCYLLPKDENQRELVLLSVQNIDMEKAMQARVETVRKSIYNSKDSALSYFVGNVTAQTVVEYKSPLSAHVTDNPEIDWSQFVKQICQQLCSETEKELFLKNHQPDVLTAKYRSGDITEEYHARIVLADGNTFWTRHVLSLLEDPVSHDILLYEYVYDVSQEKIMDALLRYETNRGCETVGVLFVSDYRFIVLELNADGEGHAKKTVMPFRDYIQKVAETEIHPDDRERFLRHYSMEQEFWMEEHAAADIVYRTVRNGKVSYMSDTCYRYDEDGQIFCVLSQRNVTELIQQEEEKNRRLADALDKAEKASQAKNGFLARMSHDMRTPMNAILGMAHLAAEDGKKGLPTLDYISQIQESSQYLLGVINDILEMGRIDSGKVTLTLGWYKVNDITLPVVRMVTPLMEKKEIHFEYSKKILQWHNIEINVDIQKTQQLMMNLLNNACKFTPEGGTVRMRFSNVMMDREKGICTDKIIIEDTGCGMSEAFLTHIFEPFEQERLSGTESIPGSGLGLSIARSIARQMGGDITVTSELGKGSTFTVIYPYRFRIVSGDATQKPKDAEPGSLATLAGKNVLLAEDNSVNAAIATKLLKSQGMHVTVVPDGKQAADAFGQSSPGRFDLILMDIRMPVMDGLEATKCIRALDRPDAKVIPIIAMSANAFEEDRQLSIQAGMTEHLAKPVEPKKLYQTIATFLQSRAGAEASSPEEGTEKRS